MESRRLRIVRRAFSHWIQTGAVSLRASFRRHTSPSRPRLLPTVSYSSIVSLGRKPAGISSSNTSTRRKRSKSISIRRSTSCTRYCRLMDAISHTRRTSRAASMSSLDTFPGALQKSAGLQRRRDRAGVVPRRPHPLLPKRQSDDAGERHTGPATRGFEAVPPFRGRLPFGLYRPNRQLRRVPRWPELRDAPRHRRWPRARKSRSF